MGRVVALMKRWWVLALVFTLALSLTSCAKRTAVTDNSGNFGFGYCDGTLGQFDVYVIPNQANNGTYDVSIIPIQVDDPGDVVSVAIANQNPSYRVLVPETALNDQQEIFAGTITDSDLQNFTLLDLAPYQAGTSFLQGSAQKDAICQLPQPGDTGDDSTSAVQNNHMLRPRSR